MPKGKRASSVGMCPTTPIDAPQVQFESESTVQDAIALGSVPDAPRIEPDPPIDPEPPVPQTGAQKVEIEPEPEKTVKPKKRKVRDGPPKAIQRLHVFLQE